MFPPVRNYCSRKPHRLASGPCARLGLFDGMGVFAFPSKVPQHHGRWLFAFVTGIRSSVDCVDGWASSPDQISIDWPGGRVALLRNRNHEGSPLVLQRPCPRDRPPRRMPANAPRAKIRAGMEPRRECPAARDTPRPTAARIDSVRTEGQRDSRRGVLR